jgi:hypothetical protein
MTAKAQGRGEYMLSASPRLSGFTVGRLDSWTVGPFKKGQTHLIGKNKIG